MCECYDVSGPYGSRSHLDVGIGEPPKAGQLFGEAALTLAIPLILAFVVTFVLPIAGLAGQ
jgi:hypothetical protein